MKVLGIGNALVDILTSTKSDEYISQIGLIKGGMKLIKNSELAQITEFIKDKDPKMASGGSASNTISGLARLGLECGFIGNVGKDSYGDFYRKDLLHQGVTPFLSETELESGRAMCMIAPDGERTMGTYLGASLQLNAEHLDPDTFKNYHILHAEGYLVQDHELIESAFKLAKAAGLKISIDMASFNIVESELEFFQHLVRNYVDIVFANEEEAVAYTQLPAEEAARVIAQQCEIAVVKKGVKGSIICRGEEYVEVGVRKSNCIDTTGAGDLYASGFLYGYVRNLSLEQSAHIAALVSGNVVEVMGARMEQATWMDITAKVKEISAI